MHDRNDGTGDCALVSNPAADNDDLPDLVSTEEESSDATDSGDADIESDGGANTLSNTLFFVTYNDDNEEDSDFPRYTLQSGVHRFLALREFLPPCCRLNVRLLPSARIININRGQISIA